MSPKIAVQKNMKALRLIGFNVAPEDDFLESMKLYERIGKLNEK